MRTENTPEYPIKADREVSRISDLYGFGHYDSRGGFTLVQAPNLLRAFRRYLEEFAIQEENPEDRLAIRGLEEDLEWTGIEAIICDAEPTSLMGELEEGYSKEGYAWGVVEYRWKSEWHPWTDWTPTCYLIAWKRTEEQGEAEEDQEFPKSAPKIAMENVEAEDPLFPGRKVHFHNPDSYEFRVRYHQFGEDAWGVALIAEGK